MITFQQLHATTNTSCQCFTYFSDGFILSLLFCRSGDIYFHVPCQYKTYPTYTTYNITTSPHSSITVYSNNYIYLMSAYKISSTCCQCACHLSLTFLDVAHIKINDLCHVYDNNQHQHILQVCQSMSISIN